MEETLKVIYVAASNEQAELLAAALIERGITAFVENEALQYAAGQMMGWPAAPRVVVHDYDAEQAREIALAFDRAGQKLATAAELESLEHDDEPQQPWPKCPGCGRRRHTSCPACETAGTTFPRGFFPEETEGSHHPDHDQNESDQNDHARPLVLVCPICDEVFEPEFLAHCEWCGHRFADGRELPAARPSEESSFNGRVAFVLAALVTVVVGTIVFFATLVAKD